MADAAGIAYEEAGAGPALVLVHGHPFDRSMWRLQLASLADGLRVVAPDLPGYGASPPRGPKVTMPELAAAVIDLADRLAVARFAVPASAWAAWWRWSSPCARRSAWLRHCGAAPSGPTTAP